MQTQVKELSTKNSQLEEYIAKNNIKSLAT